MSAWQVPVVPLRWDGVASLQRGLAIIREQTERTPKGQWVSLIGGWSPYQFKEKWMPTVKELNEAAPEEQINSTLYFYRELTVQDRRDRRLAISQDSPGTKGRLGKHASLLVRTPHGVQPLDGSDLLVAVGRTPITTGISMDMAGVGVSARGDINVNRPSGDHHTRSLSAGRVCPQRPAHRPRQFGWREAHHVRPPHRFLPVHGPTAVWISPCLARRLGR